MKLHPGGLITGFNIIIIIIIMNAISIFSSFSAIFSVVIFVRMQLTLKIVSFFSRNELF